MIFMICLTEFHAGAVPTKNLKELRNMYHYLPKYWGLLKGMQSRIDRPFYSGKTIFEIEERFKLEDAQMNFMDILQ